MKRPAFQFYPADWRKDSALQSCSIAARGLWIELICVMHECEPYGVLAINGVPMSLAQLARVVGESQATVRRLLTELEAAGVFGRGDSGSIYSRRMRKDEHIREVRAASGRLGGNPNLLKQNDKQTDNQIPTPSSAPSSSSSDFSVASTQQAPQVLQGPHFAARACLLMKEAGCGARVNPSDPNLLAALAEGVTPEALADTVREGVASGKTAPFRWAIQTARGRQASGPSPAPKGAPRNSDQPRSGAHRPYIREKRERRDPSAGAPQAASAIFASLGIDQREAP